MVIPTAFINVILHKSSIIILKGYSSSDRQQYVGEIIGYDKEAKCLEIDVENKFSVRDKLELVIPSSNIVLTLNKMHDKDGDTIDVAPGSGHQVKIPYDGIVPERGLLARYLRNQ